MEMPIQTPNNINPVSSSLDSSPIIPQRSKIKNELHIKERPDLTEKQKEFVELALNKNTKLIFVEGPAGTSKSYTTAYISLLLMNQRKISDIVYVRSAVESSDKSIGYLPGNLVDKLAVYTDIIWDKLEELLPKNEIAILKKEERITGLGLGFLRGKTFSSRVVILDEAQNSNFKEILTFISRAGEYSKLFVIGDKLQSDLKIGNRGGFEKMIDCFDDAESRDNGIFTFRFGTEDIVRSKLVRFIIERVEKMNSSKEPIHC